MVDFDPQVMLGKMWGNSLKDNLPCRGSNSHRALAQVASPNGFLQIPKQAFVASGLAQPEGQISLAAEEVQKFIPKQPEPLNPSPIPKDRDPKPTCEAQRAPTSGSSPLVILGSIIVTWG